MEMEVMIAFWFTCLLRNNNTNYSSNHKIKKWPQTKIDPDQNKEGNKNNEYKFLDLCMMCLYQVYTDIYFCLK